MFICVIQKVQLEALGARKARISAIPNAVSFWVQKETKAFLCTLDALPDTKRMVYAIYMHRVSFSKAQKGQCFQQHDVPRLIPSDWLRKVLIQQDRFKNII